MAGGLQPLVSNQRIANADGTPTEYFIRWAQAKQIDIGGAITSSEALALIEQFLTDHPLSSGVGIHLTPSGDIGAGVTIAAQVQGILDQISTTRGTVLYRGAAGWAGLAPGTAGQLLKTNGPGADPEWVSGGGGGGAIAMIQRQVIAAAVPTIAFSAIPATYEDLILVITGQLTGAANFVWGSLNGDFAANYQYIRGVFENVSAFAQNGTSTGLNVGLLDGSATGPTFAGILEATIYSYARTIYRKRSLARSTLRIGAATTQLLSETHTSEWTGNAAVNALTLTAASGNFGIGTVATLYGRG